MKRKKAAEAETNAAKGKQTAEPALAAKPKTNTEEGEVAAADLVVGGVVKKFKGSPRRLHYNRVYHKIRLLLKSEGVDAEEGKLRAISAAHESCRKLGH